MTFSGKILQFILKIFIKIFVGTIGQELFEAAKETKPYCGKCRYLESEKKVSDRCQKTP